MIETGSKDDPTQGSWIAANQNSARSYLPPIPKGEMILYWLEERGADQERADCAHLGRIRRHRLHGGPARQAGVRFREGD